MDNKIDLDEKTNVSDYEPTDSEDELSEGEKELLKEVRQSNRRNVDAKQQVLAFDDSEESSDEDLMADSDIEGAGGNEEDGLPDAMDWGDKARNYYNTDFVDPDYDAYNEQEVEMAEQEEEEAKNIQQRLLQQMNEADFMLDSSLLKSAETQTHDTVATKVKADLSGLSKREKQRLFQEDSPEFLGLTTDFVAYLEEQRSLVAPVLNYVAANNVPLIPAFKFSRLHQQLVLTFCSNVSFYLLLKSKRLCIRSHPVTKQLLRLQLLLKELKPKYETVIRPQLEALLERIVDGDEIEVLDMQPVSKKKTKLNILEAYEQSSTPLDSQISAEEDVEEEQMAEEDVDEETRRGITYQIAKNKGLMPHRKKELRNPRVKHRTKFRKALIRRKGAVRTVRTETKRYGGEMSGIKTTVSKSIKFKV